MRRLRPTAAEFDFFNWCSDNCSDTVGPVSSLGGSPRSKNEKETVPVVRVSGLSMLAALIRFL